MALDDFRTAVTPAAQWIPVILPGLARPRMRAYPVYTVIAEKLEAMVQLGFANNRMKDFYDLEFLFSRFPLDSTVLRQAIQRNFARRGTALPSILFAPEFAREKPMPWQQFLRRNKLSTPTRSWDEILRHLEEQMSETLSGSKGL